MAFLALGVRSSALGLVLLLCQTAAGQLPPASVAVPRDILRAFDLRQATVQDLVLPPAGRSLSVYVTLDGHGRRLLLRPHDVRAADFKLLLDRGGELTELRPAPSLTYRGAVEGDPAGRFLLFDLA